MPTLKRCIIAVLFLGLMWAGAILVLASLPPPKQREITVDVQQDRFYKSPGARAGSVGAGPLGRERSSRLANTLEAIKLGH